MSKENENLLSKDTSSTTTPSRGSLQEKLKTPSRPQSSPEKKEYAARNRELDSFLANSVEGLDKMFPNREWRKMYMGCLERYLDKIQNGMDDPDWAQYSWEKLLPLRESIVKNSEWPKGMKKPNPNADVQYWMKVLPRIVDLYRDIMDDPNNQTDELTTPEE